MQRLFYKEKHNIDFEPVKIIEKVHIIWILLFNLKSKIKIKIYIKFWIIFFSEVFSGSVSQTEEIIDKHNKTMDKIDKKAKVNYKKNGFLKHGKSWNIWFKFFLSWQSLSNSSTDV